MKQLRTLNDFKEQVAIEMGFLDWVELTNSTDLQQIDEYEIVVKERFYKYQLSNKDNEIKQLNRLITELQGEDVVSKIDYINLKKEVSHQLIKYFGDFGGLEYHNGTDASEDFKKLYIKLTTK